MVTTRSSPLKATPSGKPPAAAASQGKKQHSQKGGSRGQKKVQQPAPAMVTTRSSPLKATPSGKLPAEPASAGKSPAAPARASSKGKKHPSPKGGSGQKKATGKVIRAAQKSTVEAAQKPLYQKAGDCSASKPTSWFSAEEDVFLCRAYVNCTNDPIKGSQQKSNTFWNKVRSKFYELMEDEGGNNVPESSRRNINSLMNRFKKTIGRDVSSFNQYYKQVAEKNPSGWTKQMIMDTAIQVYYEMEGKAFKFDKCAKILHGLAKFNPMIMSKGDDDATESGGTTNRVETVMGAKIERPIGTKKAKRLKREAPAEAERMETMKRMADSSMELAQAMKRRVYQDGLYKRMEMYHKFGMKDEAMALMKKMEDDDESDNKNKSEKESVDGNDNDDSNGVDTIEDSGDDDEWLRGTKKVFSLEKADGNSLDNNDADDADDDADDADDDSIDIDDVPWACTHCNSPDPKARRCQCGAEIVCHLCMYGRFGLDDMGKTTLCRRCAPQELVDILDANLAKKKEG